MTRRSPCGLSVFFTAVLGTQSTSLADAVTKLAPLPSGADFSGVAFTSPDCGWIAGDPHALLNTCDGGQIWNSITTPGIASEPFYDIAFATPQIGMISGNANEMQIDVYRTVNGGTTWQPVSGFQPGGSWRHIQFIGTTTAFMGSNGALARSTTSGASWSIRSAYPDCPVIYGMDFKDANIGLACGYQISSGQEGIFKTSNGGQTWSLRHAGLVNHAVFLTATTAVACDSTTIIQSTDAGDTWMPVGSVDSGLMSMARVDDSTVVGVSTGGDIWRSADEGYSWSRQHIGIGDLPRAWRVRFLDPLVGHVVGPAGAIRRTTDGGITWTVINRGANVEWRGMVAFSDTEILQAGVHGYVQRTVDAGEHWETQLIDPPAFMHDSLFTDVDITEPYSAYVVGHEGGMFKTLDGGESWMNLSSSVNPSYYPNAVDFVDANNGWVAGVDHQLGPKTHIRRTFDGGSSWEPATLNVPALDVEFSGETGYVLLYSQGLYKTVDGGATWTPMLIATPTGGPSTSYRMSWASAQIGYVAGYDGFLARTSNGGATWARVQRERSSFVYLGVKAVGTHEVWACGALQGGGDAVVLRSMDAGATWTSWPLPGQFTTPVCITLTSQRAYVAGYGGEVWRFDRILPAVPGDIDGNGIADLTDADLFISVLLGTHVDPDHTARSDMNGNGAANGADIQPFVNALLHG